MLRNKNPNSVNSIVKLFPRLAPAVVVTKVRIERPRPSNRAATVLNASPHQDERARVRARLLRMILDNERSRRYDNRPDAS
jgi:hypothetical protein